MYISNADLDVLRAYRAKPKLANALLRAAVAVILRDTDRGTEFLLMQRAKHDADPWSGQMSFPGGKIEKSDENAKAAAIREAEEEVGAQLKEADYVGQIDDLYGLKVNGVFSVHVSCFIFKPERELTLTANHEVADLVWLPISYLSDVVHAHDFKHPHDPALNMPAVLVNQEKEQVLWGLSLRMLAILYEILNKPMGVLNQSQQRELRAIETRELSPSSIAHHSSKENAEADAKKLDSITQKLVEKIK